MTKDTVTLSTACWGTGGWCGFGFGQGTMEGNYAIVSTTAGVREYILSKGSQDQSENEVFSGLTVLENTSDMMTRWATVSRPRISADGFTFPFDSTGATNSFQIDMITAKADYYEPDIYYHGSQCQAYESLTLTLEGGESSSGGKSSGGGSSGGSSGNSGGSGGKGGGELEREMFVGAFEGDVGVKSLTTSEAVLGAVLLFVAAIVIDQIWRWSTSDGSKLQVSTGDDADAPLLSHA